MLEHIFRFVLLLAVGVVPIYFMEIDDKPAIMIGWVIGATLAYIIGNWILRNKRKKKKFDMHDRR